MIQKKRKSNIETSEEDLDRTPTRKKIKGKSESSWEYVNPNYSTTAHAKCPYSCA
jgi:hypothetical protein